MKVIYRFPTFGWMLRLEFKLQDFWVGLFWKNTPERLDIWICLIPCLPLHYASPVNGDGEDK